MNRERLVKSSIFCALVSAAFASCTVEGLPTSVGEPGEGGDAGSGEPDTMKSGAAGMGGKAAGGSNGGKGQTGGDATQLGGADSGTAGDSTLGGDSGQGGAGGDSGQGGAGGDGPDCGDTMTDENNCGTCGHVCSCGKCTDGECQPTVITRTEAYVGQRLVAVDSTAYFGWTDEVFTLSVADSAAKKLASMPSWGLALSSQYLYGTNRTGSGRVERVSKAGGAVEPVAPSEAWPTGIDVFEKGGTVSVFWAAYFAGSVRGKVGSGSPFDVCTGLTTPVHVTASENRVYVAQPDTGQKSKIHWCDVSPKAEGDLVTGLTGLGIIKRHNDALFWWVENGGGANGSIAKRVIASGPTTTPLTNIEPHGIALDDESIYYLDGFVIKRAGHDGTGKKQLTELADKTIVDLAVDDQCVYWHYSNGNGSLGRVDKD